MPRLFSLRLREGSVLAPLNISETKTFAESAAQACALAHARWQGKPPGVQVIELLDKAGSLVIGIAYRSSVAPPLWRSRLGV